MTKLAGAEQYWSSVYAWQVGWSHCYEWSRAIERWFPCVPTRSDPCFICPGRKTFLISFGRRKLDGVTRRSQYKGTVLDLDKNVNIFYKICYLASLSFLAWPSSVYIMLGQSQYSICKAATNEIHIQSPSLNSSKENTVHRTFSVNLFSYLRYMGHSKKNELRYKMYSSQSVDIRCTYIDIFFIVKFFIN